MPSRPTREPACRRSKSSSNRSSPSTRPASSRTSPTTSAAITGQAAGLDAVRNVEELVELIQQVSGATGYLTTAEAVLPAENPWLEEVKTVRGELLTKLSSPKQRSDPAFQRHLGQALAQLKTKYRDTYLALHQKVRLTANEDKKKAEIVKDSRLAQLQKLSGIEMMPAQQLKDLQDSLFALKTCFAVTKPELDAAPICPHCNFRPVEEPAKGPRAGDVLAKVDDRLDELIKEWTQTLLSNLADPTVAEGIDLIDSGPAKKAVKEFVKSKELPEPLNNNFLKAMQEVLSGLQPVTHQQGRGPRGAGQGRRALHRQRPGRALRRIRPRIGQRQRCEQDPCRCRMKGDGMSILLDSARQQPLEIGRNVYPQPVATACGYILRAGSPEHLLEATLKAAEVLAQYLGALALTSYACPAKRATGPRISTR